MSPALHVSLASVYHHSRIAISLSNPYLSQVLAGEYGVAKHPLFCIFPDDSPVLVNIRQSMASSQGEGESQAEQGGAGGRVPGREVGP